MVTGSLFSADAVLSQQSSSGFMLAGRNLGDEVILVSGSSGYATGSGYTTGTHARKSEWSLSAKYRF